MRLIDSLLSIIYPRTCPVCGRAIVQGETTMCMTCRVNLPETGFHRKADFNAIHERTMLHVPPRRATSMFFYERKSPYAALIHRAKYSGFPSEARALATEYSRSILPTGFFEGIDLIQPVPLSFARMVSRGYNQSHHIALGVADATGIAIGSLLRARRHSTQTRKGVADRMQNALGTYSVSPRAAARISTAPTHVLLVDDIITTGATLTACADALRRAFPSVEVSLLTLAATRLG